MHRSLAVALVLGASSCGPPPEPPDLDRINLAQVTPDTVLPGTRMSFIGSGFLRGEVVTAQFRGTYANGTVDDTIGLDYIDSNTQQLVVGPSFLALLGAATGTFSGDVTLRVNRDGRALEDTANVAFVVVPTLTPVLLQLDSNVLAFMETLSIDGRGFLLEGEGQTRFLFDGTYTPTGGSPQTLTARELPVEQLDRREALYVHTPGFLGLSTGVLDGDLTVENEHASGELVTGGTIPLRLDILEPALASASPTAASRGQLIQLLGRGFVPTDTAVRQSTSIVLSGTFTDTSGNTVDVSGTNALEIFPGYTEPGVLDFVVRPERTPLGQLTGFGATTGTFEGDVTVRLRYQGVTLEGPPWRGRFTILPTKQIVFLKYLAGFSDALRRFGMRNVEREVKQRIMEVCARDYVEFNVEFRDERPVDFVDYSVIEISAVDPNDAGLFGLDNTEGKDEGNVRLNDVIGGTNAESEELGYYAFGGVFTESFLSFSPQSPSPAPIASSRFDDVFAGFIEEFGGLEIAAGEYPGGDRDLAVSEAIRVLGNLIGNTIVHEIGHSVGLAAVRGNFHHDGSTSGLIMNPGSARPFAERGEIDGQGPAFWGTIDRDYLLQYLPR